MFDHTLSFDQHIKEAKLACFHLHNIAFLSMADAESLIHAIV